jgi:fermentation-respiration switch protein FrsA (DUF1100 family)
LGTLGITLAICYVLVWSGFAESQFFRPSEMNYGEHTKLGAAREDVFFESEDGTRLHGWFVAAQGQPIGTIVHLHGSDRNISYSIKNSYWLTDHGFNLFLFDYRGYGKSEGRPDLEGVVKDATAAVKYVRTRPDVDPNSLCLWGQSMGGQLAIIASDRTESEGIRAVVAEATYASPSHHIRDKLAQMGPLWLFQWGVWLAMSDDHSALAVVDRIPPARLLLVHGTEDRGVRPYHSEWLFRAAQQPKDIWLVRGARHLAIFEDPLHRERLIEFLKTSVGVDSGADGQNAPPP